MGGGGSQTTTPPPPTENELALQAEQLNIAREQLAALKTSNAFQGKLFDAAGPLIEAQTGLLKQQLDRANSPEAKQLQDAQDAFSLSQLQSAQRLGPVQEEILNMQLDSLRRGGAATPEQKALIEKATQGQIDAGNISIDRNAADAMRVLGSELAPSLGLSSRDTPIQDRAALVAAETVRQKGALEAGLRGQAASTELGLPFQSGGLNLATSGQISPLERFQQELAASATTNRLQLFGGGSSFLGNTNNSGIGLAGIGPNGVGFRTTGPTTTRGSTDNTMQLIGSGIGAAATIAAASISSRAAKEGGRPVDGAAILHALMNTPVERWRYIGDPTEHVGPYAEDFRQSFDLGDGKTINLMDAIGVLFAAVGELGRRVSPEPAFKAGEL